MKLKRNDWGLQAFNKIMINIGLMVGVDSLQPRNYFV
jgi:hypothetical protein